jgi:hypothetical protein
MKRANHFIHAAVSEVIAPPAGSAEEE